jgi:DNA-binding MarR family transcriptional regulator
VEQPTSDAHVALRAIGHARIARVLFPPAREKGFTAQDEQVLVAVYALGSPTVGDVGRALGLNPSSIDGALRRLEALGYVRRVADPAAEDRRRKAVWISDTGIKQALEVVGAIRERAAGHHVDLGGPPAA